MRPRHRMSFHSLVEGLRSPRIGRRFERFTPRSSEELAEVVAVMTSQATNAASFFRPRWMLTLTSAADWPVAPDARALLGPFSFTRRLTLACAGFNRPRRSSTAAALIAAVP